MGIGNNQFTAFLRLQMDGSIKTEIKSFEKLISESVQGAAAKATGASSVVAKTFQLNRERANVAALKKEIDNLFTALGRERADVFGIQKSLSGAGTSPLLAGLREQQAAGQALDQQRQKAFAEDEKARQARIAGVQQEFDAAIRGINAEKAARDAAQADALRGIQQTISAVESIGQQRAEAARKAVSGREFIQAPGFDPQAAAQAAAAARQHAIALDGVAAAAERSAATNAKATLQDRQYAAAMRDAAAAASLEAARLEGLSDVQQRVANSTKGLNGANLELQTGVRNTRFATLQASQQFQDFFIQIQGGQNPMVAFSQQASQLAFVMAGVGGKAGGLARLFAGPWGTAFFIAMAALTPFVSKLFEADDATKKTTKSVEDQIAELVANAEASRSAAAAQAHYTRTAEGAAAAIAEVTKELDRQNRSLQQNADAKKFDIELAKAAAEQKIGDLQAALPGKEAEVARTRALRDAAAKGRTNAVGEATFQLAERSFKKAETELYRYRQSLLYFEDAVNKAGQALIDINLPLIDRAARDAVDPISAINTKYEEQAAAAKKAAQGNAELTRTLQGRLTTIYALQRAEVDRAQAAKSAEKGQRETVQFGSPVPGAPVTSGYGPRRAPIAGASTNHLGLDFGAREGTAVLAAMDGIVRFADKVAGYGNQIELNHGAGTATRYSHLSRFNVADGQTVQKGDKIGEVGSTGTSTNPHLHYEVLVNGKKVDPTKGMFAVDTTRIAEGGQRWAEAQQKAAQALATEQERLQRVYDTSAESIADINARFDKQPRLVDQAADAQRKLAVLIQESALAQADYTYQIEKLKADKPVGFEVDVAKLEKARASFDGIAASARATAPVIQEGLVRPLSDMVEASEQQLAIDSLILAGKEGQAEVMREVNRLQAQMGDLLPEELKAVEHIVAAERIRGKVLADNEAAIRRQVEAAESVQAALTGIIANPTDLNSFKDAFEGVFSTFQKQWADELSKSLFGDMGKTAEDELRGASVDMSQSAAKHMDAAATWLNVALEMRKSVAGAGPSIGQVAATPSAYGLGGANSPLAAAGDLLGVDLGRVLGDFDKAFGITGAAGGVSGAENPAEQVVVTANRAAAEAAKAEKARASSAMGLSVTEYFNKQGAAMGRSVDKLLGSGEFFSKIGGKLGTALEGVQLGQIGSGVAGLLGFKTSDLGASIGGALGNVILPGIGGFIGGALGGIVGGLFKKSKTGSASIGLTESGALGVVGTRGNSTSAKDVSVKAAGAIIDPLEDFAERIGVALDASKGAVSIGLGDKYYKVDTEGRGRTSGSGVQTGFKEDAQAAIEFAIRDLIKDGVLGPIREGTKKLLLSSRGLASAMEKALQFEGVFKRLKQFTDPVGAAIDELNVEFDNLRRLFKEAGASTAEYADLEKLYAFERAEAVKSAAKDMTSTLKALLDDLTYQGDTGLSLRTREKNANAAFQPLAGQITSGQAVDQEEFARVARSLLDIQREIYGSTSAYFDSLDYVTNLTKQAISNAGGTTAVTLPGITPAPTYNVPIPANNNTPGTVGYSTTAPGGALTTASNDNAAMGATVAASIKEQTAAMLPLMQPAAIAAAITTGLGGVRFPTLLSGGTQGLPTLLPVTTAIRDQTSAVTSRLDGLIDVGAETNQRLAVAGQTDALISPTALPVSRLGLSIVSATSAGGYTAGSAFGARLSLFG